MEMEATTAAKKLVLRYIDKNNNFSEKHKELLKEQLSAMYQYLDILERRLRLFEQALESNDIPKEFLPGLFLFIQAYNRETSLRIIL